MDKTIYDAFEELKQSVFEMWESIVDAFYFLIDVAEEVKQEEKYRETWFVPKKITKNHQVLNRKPLLANIRNAI